MLTALLIPLPFIIRVILYHKFEEDELVTRKQTLNRLNLKSVYEHNFLQFFGAGHTIFLVCYVSYGVTILFLALFWHWNRNKFDTIVWQPLRDLHQVKKRNGLRLIIFHLIYPISEFGLKGILSKICRFYNEVI